MREAVRRLEVTNFVHLNAIPCTLRSPNVLKAATTTRPLTLPIVLHGERRP